jgi:hypothetical protein
VTADHSTADRLRDAVTAWLKTLDAGQQRTASFAFDDPDRFVWAFTPGDRRGLAIRDMSAGQRSAAIAVVDVAMSERGAREVAGIMALETILGAIEREQGRMNWRRRDPDLFWFAVFGDPRGDDPWMWRVGGHHVAVAVTVAGGHVLGSTPSFLGANPSVVPSGPRAGTRVLTGEESLARELLAELSGPARAAAVVNAVAPPEILTSNAARADARSVPRGVAYGAMDDTARSAFERLIRHYLGRSAPDVAREAWERAVIDGLPETTFAWAGPTEPGRGHYYGVVGPRLLIEYDNTQNGANHLHAVWRDLENDWGQDLLAAHYASAHRG